MPAPPRTRTACCRCRTTRRSHEKRLAQVRPPPGDIIAEVLRDLRIRRVDTCHRDSPPALRIACARTASRRMRAPTGSLFPERIHKSARRSEAHRRRHARHRSGHAGAPSISCAARASRNGWVVLDGRRSDRRGRAPRRQPGDLRARLRARAHHRGAGTTRLRSARRRQRADSRGRAHHHRHLPALGEDRLLRRHHAHGGERAAASRACGPCTTRCSPAQRGALR